MFQALLSSAVHWALLLLFILMLPFVALAVHCLPGVSGDEVWVLNTTFTFVAPFSAVLWYIVLHRLLTRRPTSYGMQFSVLVAAAALVYILLRLGVYSL